MSADRYPGGVDHDRRCPGRRWRRRRRGGEAPHVAGAGHVRRGPADDLPEVGFAWGQRRQQERLRRRAVARRTEEPVGGEERGIGRRAEVDVVVLAPEPAVPLQPDAGRADAGRGVHRLADDRPVRRQRDEGSGLHRADRIRVVPAAVEVGLEVIEDEGLRREQVVLVLRVRRRRRPVGRSEDGHPLTLVHRQLPVVDAFMDGELHRDAGGEQAIEVERDRAAS